MNSPKSSNRVRSVLLLTVLLACLLPGTWAEGTDKVTVGDVTLFSSPEGALTPRTVDGKSGWAVTGGTFLYGNVRPVKGSHLRLTFRLHDGGVKGVVGLPYDSSDETVSPSDPHPGAWKRSGLALPGTGTWTTVSVDWPDARLAKGCNGYDFRLEMPAAATVGPVRVQELAPVVTVRPQRLPLSPLASDVAAVNGDSLRLPGSFVQAGDSPIVFNAADATTLGMAPNGGFGSDGGPAGGRYIHYVDNAEYEFTVTTPGKYQLWERASFPVHGYNHQENLEDNQGGDVTDDTPQTPLGQWVWVKAVAYTLSAGRHRLKLSYNGGAKLDRLAFTHDVTPPAGDGGALSRNVGPSSAVVETADAAPLDVASWLSITGDADARGGQAAIEVSSDGGAAWSVLPTNGDLSALPVRGGGKDHIRLRFTLRSAPDGSSPILQGYQAVYREGPRNEIVLAGRDLRLAFGPTGLRRLHSTASGTDFLWGGSEAPLFQLCVKPVGSAAPVWVSSTQATVTGRTLVGDTLTQRYRLPQGIDVTCRVRVAGGSSRWGLDIVNGSQLEVCAAQYPMLQGVRVGPSSDGESLVLLDGWRQLLRDPMKVGINEVVRDPAMHWTYLYNSRAGLYLGDENWPSNDFLVTVLRHDPTTLQYGLTREFRVAPGRHRDSPDYVVDVRPGGDWHSGADVYRAWAATHLKKPFLPAWTRRMDGWREYDSDPVQNTSVANVGTSEDYALEVGLGTYMGANRLQLDGPIEYVGFMQTYCPAWGSLQEYEDAFRELREMGGHLTPYLNWFCTSPTREVGQERIAGLIPRSWVEQAPPWHDAAWYDKTAWRWYSWGKPDLGTTQDELQQGLASPNWQRHHYDRTKLWVQTYGTDGMYFDQLNVPVQIASLDPAYNKFGDYGTWERGTQENLEQIATDMRKSDPHYVSSGEVANAVTGQSNTFAMTSAVFSRFDILHYCVPEQNNLDGNWNGGLSADLGGDERLRFDWMMGARFEVKWVDPYVSRLITLRRRVDQLLYAGTFLDTAGLTLTQGGKAVANPKPISVGFEFAPNAGPQAKWFLMGGSDKGAIVNVIADPPAAGTSAPLTVSVPAAAFGPVRVAWALGLDGTTRRVPFMLSAGRCSFTLPGNQKATTVLLVNHVGPQFTNLSLPFAGAPGATMTGQANIVSYNAAPEPVTLGWQAPTGWHGAGGSVTLAPGKETAAPVGLTLPPAGLGKREDLTLTAISGPDTGTYPHWVTITDPLWVRLLRQPDGHVEATVFNRSDKALDGTVTLTVPNGVTLSPASLPFHAAPWSRTVLQTQLTGMETQQAPIHVAARAVAGNASAERTLMLYPPAANGGFEADSAGDGRPDWWHSYGDDGKGGFASTAHIDSARLDPDHPHSGRYCLRLDPLPNPGGATYAEPFVHAIDAGRKYHLRVAVRKTDPADDVGVNLSGYQSLSPPPVAGQWSLLDSDFTTHADGDLLIQFVNKSRHPVWFDDLTITPIP